MPVEKRSYGQGAQGEFPSQALRVSFAMKVRYYWDNFVSRPSIFVTIMIVGSAIFALLLTFLSYANGSATEQDQRWSTRTDFLVRLWFVFSLIFMPAGSRLEGTNIDRSIAVLLWLGNLVFNSVAFAFVTAKLIEVFNRLKNARSIVIDSDHTLILGWSNRIFSLLRELNVAHSGQKKASVVILCGKDRANMLQEVTSRAGALPNLKLVFRSGDITNSEDLARVNSPSARSIIILDDASGSDAQVVAAVLALKTTGVQGVPIIAEIDDEAVGDSLRASSKAQVIPVRSEQVIARVTAQASRQNGLAAVVLDLLDFAGAEIYFAKFEQLVGQKYLDALLSFETSSVVGLVSADGKIKLNPSNGYLVQPGDQLILISEDDSSIDFSGIQKASPRNQNLDFVEQPHPVSLLILGWSSMGLAMLKDLVKLLPVGSSLTVAAHPNKADLAALKTWRSEEVQVNLVELENSVSDLRAVTSQKPFDEIIVLGYRENISVADSDAYTMLTMLHLSSLNLKNRNSEPTRLVAEILDSRKAGLARSASEGDLVISDNLAALVLAQLSENPELAGVFDELFGASATSIQIKRIEKYADLNAPVSFADLVATAAERNESAFGYKFASSESSDGSTGVRLNPSKMDMFVPAAGDSLIVVAEF